MKRYILRAYYIDFRGVRTLADFIVTSPVVCEDGIWATSRTAWGGQTRNFYAASNVVALYEERNMSPVW